MKIKNDCPQGRFGRKDKKDMSFSNQRTRDEIMEILDNNSKDIPDGVYLELCNKLMKFKFDDEDEIQDRESIMLDLIRTQNILIITQNSESSRENLRRYVINPDTGRQVLRRGRVGRRLARQ